VGAHRRHREPHRGSRARTHVGAIAVHWTDTLPAASAIETSLDGSSWSAAPPADSSGTLRNPVWARYVRVTMTRADNAPRTGVRELVVSAAE
jgi:hypothetical protein